MANELNYVTGDATRPGGSDPRIIVHVCNDIGGWGRGFVVALSKRWPEPEKAYRTWHASQEGFALGEVQFIEVEPQLWVANLIGQHGVRRGPDGTPPIRYAAVRSALARIRAFAWQHQASLHLPRIGAGLAGGDWPTIEAIIQQEIVAHGLSATVYDLP